MKQTTTTLILLMLSTILFSQNIKRIENLKDAWDLTYTYTGEVKNGKPDGMGVATYSSGNASRYVGNFSNGMYNGKGVMLFKDSVSFLAGEWRGGKLNGKGANLMSGGSIYIGDFANGVKNGRGVLFYADNSAMVASYRDDKLNGRGISIWKDGNIISDCIYDNDLRNGTGYQYEAKTKNLYKGEWKDDKWVEAATPAFSSFLTASSFTGEVTDGHVLMGPVNSSKFLTDSSYYYDLVKHKRYFGYFEGGHLRNGIIIRDDSTRFWGRLDDVGATGYCYDYKTKSYYTEGNYANDLLKGKIMDIDLAKQSVYFGDVTDGSYTGKAYFFNGRGTMYSGDYVKGRFSGTGYRLETNGRYTLGTWEEGAVKELLSVQTPKGEIISGHPKTFAEGINIAIKAFPNVFDDVYGQESFEDMEDIDPDYDLDYTESLVDIPGSISKNVIGEDYIDNTFYYAKFLETDNAAKAKAKYNELASQLQSAVISNAFITGKQKLTGKVVAPETSAEKTVSVFTISGNDEKYKDFHVWLRLRKNDSDEYIVEIMLGEKEDKY